jgi:hypothetical protein
MEIIEQIHPLESRDYAKERLILNLVGFELRRNRCWIGSN